MRNIFLLLFALQLLTSCLTTPSTKGISLDWIVGRWIRLNEDAGKDTYETWEKIDENHYSGFSYTLELEDTINFEIMELERINNIWLFSVHLNDSLPATHFHLTHLSSDEFVCENLENDFPTRIRYWMDGRMMRADVSNDKHAISYEYGKLGK